MLEKDDVVTAALGRAPHRAIPRGQARRDPAAQPAREPLGDRQLPGAILGAAGELQRHAAVREGKVDLYRQRSRVVGEAHPNVVPRALASTTRTGTRLSAGKLGGAARQHPDLDGIVSGLEVAWKSDSLPPPSSAWCGEVEECELVERVARRHPVLGLAVDPVAARIRNDLIVLLVHAAALDEPTIEAKRVERGGGYPRGQLVARPQSRGTALSGALKTNASFPRSRTIC